MPATKYRAICEVMSLRLTCGQSKAMTRGTTEVAESRQVSDSSQPGVSILLVDDDVELCELLQQFFARRDIRVETVHDGRRGLARAGRRA